MADDDPTRARVKVTMVDADGDPIRLLRQNRIGEGPCQVYADYGQDIWCYADVHVVADGNATSFRVTPRSSAGRLIRMYNRSEDVFATAYNRDSSDMHDAARKANGWATFEIYPNVGEIIIRTDVIAGDVYHATIDSSALIAGEHNPVTVSMSKMPKIQVITELTADPGTTLVEFPEDLPSDALPVIREDGSQSLAGTWVVQPDAYQINDDLIPDNMRAMISHNGEVKPLEPGEILDIKLDDVVVISVGSTVE